MPTPEKFLEATQWFGLATLGFAVITLLAFVLKWGFRFRLVGATSLMGVLTAGMFGLSFEPFTRTVIPGAIAYTSVYDSGTNQIVIQVPTTITESQLEATLRQAASNLLGSGRQSVQGQAPTIRARVVLHKQPGISELVYIGQIQPLPNPKTGEPTTLSINTQKLAQLSSSPSS